MRNLSSVLENPNRRTTCDRSGGRAKLRTAWSLLVAGLILLAGCRSNNMPTGVDLETRIRLNALADFYKQFLDANRGRPPKDPQAFRAFLDTHSETIELYRERELISSVDEMLTSARDEQPFTIVCGKKIGVWHKPGADWATHEQTGVDRMRLAARVQGGVDVLDEQQFAQEFQ